MTTPPPAQQAQQPARWVSYGCLGLSMALVGSYVALSKPLLAVLPVYLLAWLRFGLGGLAMLHWLKKPAHEAPLSAATRRLLFLESLLGNFLFTLCMLAGVRLTSAVSAGVIMAGIPAAVALLSWVFLREQIGTRIWAAVACAALGMALLALSKSELSVQSASAPDLDFTANNRLIGPLLVLAAVLCEAAYAVIGKKLTGALGPKRICALINLWGLALMTPLGLTQALQFDFASVPAGLWLLLLFYALAASVWTVWLWMTGLQGVPAAQAGVFTVLLPVSATLVGVGVLGETVGGWQALALLLALAGVLLATWPQAPAARSGSAK